MLKTYEKYIIKNFFYKFFSITLIFFSLTIILGSLEEVSFVKKMNVNFLFPYYLTLLNAPITVFEMFPFILLLTTQLLFYELHKKDELNMLKFLGLKNLSLIKIIFLISIFIGLFNVIFYYNLASNLKFHYSNLKNSLSDDNKYLAMVTKSGLWIKDEVDGKKLIIKSSSINLNILSNTTISELDENFELIRVIQSDKIDIKNNDWIIYEPIITKNNLSFFPNQKMIFKTSFNYEKISKIFSDISTLDLKKLFELKNDYEKLGYSSNQIMIHLFKLSTIPLFYGILVILASIIMFNLKKNNSVLFHLAIGFLISVAIYYLMFFFSSLGNTGKTPVNMSILFPMLILSMLCIIGVININEK